METPQHLLDNLFQWLTTHHREKHFLIFRWNFFCCRLFLLFLIQSLGTTEKSMGPSPLLFPSIMYILIYKDKIPVDFQFSRLNRLISVFHHMTDLQSLNHLHDTALDLLQYIHVSFVPKARHRSQMRLNRAEKRKRITFLDLLATLCLRQLRRILASFITGEYCWIKSVRISRTSAAKQLSSWYALACSGACYFSPVAGLGISLC